MDPTNAPTADPSLWSEHGLPGLVIFALFAIIILGARAVLNRAKEQDAAALKERQESEKRYIESVTKIDDRAHEAQKEWRETVQEIHRANVEKTTALTAVVDDLSKAIGQMSYKLGMKKPGE